MDYRVFHRIIIFISSSEYEELLPEAPEPHIRSGFYPLGNIDLGPDEGIDSLGVQHVEVVEADRLAIFESLSSKNEDSVVY